MNATEAMKTLPANPLGLDGVEFIEYAGSDRAHFEKLFQQFGFEEVGQVHGKNIRIYGQNDIHFILNCEPQTFAASFAQAHGPAICATGFRFLDAQKAFDLAVARGARPYTGTDHEKGATPFPAVYGIGDSLIYFIDEANRKKLYESIFQIPKDKWKPKGFGFQVVDHFTNNVPRGEMQKWCDFYIKIFGFYEARFFDIRGSKTGLISKVMRSPCGKFSVPINEPTESKSQIQEYLDEYKGSGIQHLALISENILDSIQTLETKEVQFLTPPPKTYYDMIPTRVAHVVEDLEQLRKHAILVDGDQKGYLLQIFTKNVIGPIFFEVIQRKGHDGFGDGNFQALFDAIERDQKERGYL